MNEMNMKRRMLLKGSLAVSSLSVAVGAGLINPRAVLAAWPKSAFEAKSVDAAMKAVADTSSPSESDSIKIKAPDIAENGAVVPITVTAEMPNVESIAIMASENASPLAADFRLADRTQGYISTRIKMGETGDVIALVKADGKVFSARKNVKVTIGGCGG